MGDAATTAWSIIVNQATAHPWLLRRMPLRRRATLAACMSSHLTEAEPMGEQNQPQAQLEPILVRVEEAARILSLSRSMIYQMLDRGELPSVRCGTARRIPLAALHAWVERQISVP